MRRLTIWGQGPRNMGPILQANRMSDSTTRAIAAAVGAFWGLVLIGFAFWLSRTGSDGMGAALACLAYSIGYFRFAWTVYHDRAFFDQADRDRDY